jgi:hypothetical protein
MTKPYLIKPPSRRARTGRSASQTPTPAFIERDGSRLEVSKPTLLVNRQRQQPVDFSPFLGWFADIKQVYLDLGDYSIEGMEETCIVVRKKMSELERSLKGDRVGLMSQIHSMSEFPNRLLVIDGGLSQAQRSIGNSIARPFETRQALVAILAGQRVPFVCADTTALGTEMVASYLHSAYLYDWLDKNNFDRRLAENDL